MKNHTFKKITGQSVTLTTDDYEFNQSVKNALSEQKILKYLDQSGIIETENFDFHIIFSRNYKFHNIENCLATVNLISYNKITDETVIQSVIHCETQKIAKKYIRSIKHIEPLLEKLNKTFLVPKNNTPILLPENIQIIPETKKIISKNSKKEISAKISTPKKIETKKKISK